MIETRKIKGVVPVVITPLNKDCTVDNQGLKNLIIFLKKKKIGGFWTNMLFTDMFFQSKPTFGP